MTWFVDARAATIATVDAYADHRQPPTPPPSRRRLPFDEETKGRFSKNVSVLARRDGFVQHLILDQTGYLILSEDALAVLKRFQKDGWEAIPLKVKSSIKEAAENLAGDTYYLLNLYLHRDLVDFEKSNIQPKVVGKGTIVEKTVYWIDSEHREIAIKKGLIGDTLLWLGDGVVCGQIYFFADALKDAWCELGVNPAVFEHCLDV